MRISVAMCTYNGAAFLPAQLASIAEQTRRPDELIVCDDASTDKTRDILESFARTSSIPVSLYFSDENTGSVKNFERAIGLCTGDVIALSDQDDVWNKDKLERIEQLFRENQNVGLVFSDAELVDTDLKPLDQRMWSAVGFDAHKQKLLRDGKSLDPVTVVRFCQENMAYFMVPRYVEFVAQLPRTMTEKVEKYKLKQAAQPRLQDIWDREAAGIVVNRHTN